MGKLTVSYNNENIINTTNDGSFTLATEGKLMSDDVNIAFEKGNPPTLDVSVGIDSNGLITATATQTEGTETVGEKTRTSQVATYNFEVSPTPSLEDASWSFISYASSQGIARNYWSVGDRKSIKFETGLYVGQYAFSNNGCTYCYILEFDHNAEVEGYGISFGIGQDSEGHDMLLMCPGTESGGADGIRYFNMNHWGTSGSTKGNKNYGGWKGCDLRYDILGSTDTPPSGYEAVPTAGRVGYDASPTTATQPIFRTLMACLPADLRAVMKPITKYTDNVGGYTNDDGENIESNVTASIDYLPLLAPKEIGLTDAATNWVNSYEYDKQTVYEYYSNTYTGSSKLIVAYTNGLSNYGVQLDNGDYSNSSYFNYYPYNTDGEHITLRTPGAYYSATVTFDGETTTFSNQKGFTISGNGDVIVTIDDSKSPVVFTITTVSKSVGIGRRIKGQSPESSTGFTPFYQYWLRSPSNFDSDTFRMVRYNDTCKGHYSYYQAGLAPVFLV